MKQATPYREYLPAPVLRRYVDCYWYYYSEEGISLAHQPVKRCLPLGTTEIIVQVDRQPSLIFDGVSGNWNRSSTIYFTGLFTDTSLWKGSPGSLMFGIWLKPEALPELFRLPAAEMYNSVVEADALLGRTARQIADEMSDQPHINGLIAIAEKDLLNRLYTVSPQRNYVAEACRLIRETRGNLSIDELGRLLYISPRQLQRSFRQAFGLGPKTYQRIIRFRNAYQYARQCGSNLCWADVSYEWGYADQAHFIRDFKSFTGDSPSMINAGVYFQTLEAEASGV